jgi:hypothetical protein
MTDYLRTMNRGLRVLSAIALMLAAILFFLLFLVYAVDGVRERWFDREHLGLVAALVVTGVISVTTCYLALRLWRGRLSPNGVTVIPARFIQVFGFFWLAVVVFDVCTGNVAVSFLVEGSLTALAMIFIGRHIARRKARHQELPH